MSGKPQFKGIVSSVQGSVREPVCRTVYSLVAQHGLLHVVKLLPTSDQSETGVYGSQVDRIDGCSFQLSVCL